MILDSFGGLTFKFVLTQYPFCQYKVCENQKCTFLLFLIIKPDSTGHSTSFFLLNLAQDLKGKFLLPAIKYKSSKTPSPISTENYVFI